MQREFSPGLYEILPSGKLAESWAAFEKAKPGFLEEKRPTCLELPALHRIMTSPFGHVQITEPVILESIMQDFYTLDRPDATDKFEELRQAASRKHANFDELRRMYKEICEADTDLTVDIQLSGGLRVLGTRRIHGYPEETVHVGNLSQWCTPEEEQAIQAGTQQYPPTAFYGLTVGLPEVYTLLCETYERRFAQAANLNERLKAEAFLVLTAAQLVHPFWDANGRALLAHIALTFEREGLGLPNYRGLEKFVNDMRSLSTGLLQYALQETQVPLISGENHFFIKLNPMFRTLYMQNLRATIEEVMDDDASDEIKVYSGAGALFMKHLLKKRGLVKMSNPEMKNVAELLDQVRRAQRE